MMVGTAKFASNNVISEDILLSLETLFSTIEGTIPLDRNFGINQDILSAPAEVAENLYTLDAIEKVDIYEPRVKVVSVDFAHSDGQIIPTVHIELVGTEGGYL